MPGVNHMRLSQLNTIRLSDHFSLHEFECKGGDCCGFSVKLYPEVVECLEVVRDALSTHMGTDTPLHITSGYRCVQHNKKEGGEHHSDNPRDGLNSFHCRGRAVDLESSGVSKILIAQLALQVWPRVGLYWKTRRSRMNPRGRKVLVLHCDLGDLARPELPRRWGDGWPK